MDGVITRSCGAIRIEPYIEGQCRPLELCTSHYDNVYHKRIYDTAFPIKKENCILSSNFSFAQLKSWFPDYRVEDMNIFPHRGMGNSIAKGITLRENQVSTVEKLVACKKREIFLHLPTAFGKTFMGVYYSFVKSYKTLIICHSNKILDQWEETIEEMSLRKGRAFRITGEKGFKKLASSKMGDKDYAAMDYYDFFLVTQSSINGFASKYSWTEFGELIKGLGIGLKIIDEAHLNLGATVKINASTNILQSLYLSADATRGNLTAAKSFSNVFFRTQMIELSSEELEDLKHIIAVFTTFKSTPTNSDIYYVSGGKYGWSHTAYAKYEWENDITQSKCIQILSEILRANNGKPHYKILILLQLIDHVDEFTETLRELYKGTLTVGRYHSKMTSEEKAEALDCNIIVSIYGSFGVGVDVVNPEIRYVISTIPVDPVTTNQAGGRCRPIENRSSFLWMLYDMAFPYCVAKMGRVAKYLKNSKCKDIIQKDISEIRREEN